MKLTLRPYQEDAVTAIGNTWRSGVNKQVVVLATGLGKTIIFSHIISRIVEKTGKKALILAHRGELLLQAKDKLLTMNPLLRVEIEKASDKASENADVVVASVQTIGRSGSDRINKFNPEEFGIIVVDEAHHASADTYKNIFRYFGVLKDENDTNQKTLLLGVTATPSRNDNKGIDTIFDKVSYDYGIVGGIEDGWLSRITAWRINTNTDLSQVHKTAGDFNLKALGEAVNTEDRNGFIIKAYKQLANDTQTLCFAVNVEHAKELTKHFNDAGVVSEYIIGTSKNREEILGRFNRKEIQVLVNVGVLTEGFDEPSIKTILMARPTQSGILFQQMVGRGTRLYPGKEDVMVIDFVDNTFKQKLQTTASLLGMHGALDFKGNDILEVKEKVDQLLELAPNTNLDKLDIDKIKYAIEEVDLMSGLDVPHQVAPFTKLDWYRFGEDSYHINLADNGSMKLSKTITGQYLLSEHSYDKDTKIKKDTLVGQWGMLEDAIKNADQYIAKVHSDIMILVKNNAKWRKHGLTSGQAGMLRRFRVNSDVIDQLDRGQGSRLISRLIAGAKKWK